MSDTRWITLYCGDETRTLISRHPNAYLLLTQISMRARWKDCPITGLKAGQAQVGDWGEAGIGSEMAYRHAKKILTKLKLATFKGTNQGTIANLENSMIFNLRAPFSNGQVNDQTTGQQRTGSGQGTTNQTDIPNTQIPSLVTDSASAGSGQSPPPTKAAFPIPLMTHEEAKECAQAIRAKEISSDPCGNFAAFPQEEFNELAIDWYIKAEQSAWTIDDKPMRDAEKALHGYLRMAIKRKSKKFKELKNDETEDEEPPF